MARKQPPKTTPPAPRFSDENIADMIDARRGADLLAALDAGLDPRWTDEAGRSLAHFAALWGETETVAAFVARGVPAVSYDADGRTPEQLARAMGHDAAAYRLAALAVSAVRAETALPFGSLADMRRASFENLSDQFNHAVSRGGLAAVMTLARAAAGTPDKLTAGDLTARGADGDSTILKICQQGQLPLLMDVDVWKDAPDEFRKLWDAVPKDYAAAHDVDAFMAAAHRAQLESYVQPDFRLGTRPPKTGGKKPPQP